METTVIRLLQRAIASTPPVSQPTTRPDLRWRTPRNQPDHLDRLIAG